MWFHLLESTRLSLTVIMKLQREGCDRHVSFVQMEKFPVWSMVLLTGYVSFQFIYIFLIVI